MSLAKLETLHNATRSATEILDDHEPSTDYLMNI